MPESRSSSSTDLDSENVLVELERQIKHDLAEFNDDTLEMHEEMMAEIDMQKAHQDAGWNKVSTKGSGIVFNDAGKALFERAVERVSARVEAM